MSMNEEEQRLLDRFTKLEDEAPEDDCGDFWQDNSRLIDELAYELAALRFVGESYASCEIHFANRIINDRERMDGIDKSKVDVHTMGVALAAWLAEYVKNDANAFRQGLTRW